MNKPGMTLPQLRQMIGLQVRYRNDLWQVIELLEDGPTLVLEGLAGRKVVQGDQYGEGYRRAPRRLTVPLLDRAGEALHPDFLELELAQERP